MKRSPLPLTALCLSALACDFSKPGNLGELTDATTTATTTTTGDTDAPTTSVDPTTGSPDEAGWDDGSGGPYPAVTAVDVLFVIDNSGSMAATQQRIAEAIDSLVVPFTAGGFDLRIAVTTTDVSNPRCPSTTPENGALVASSCRARVADGEFMFVDDDLSAACLDACAHASLTILPTTTADDPVPSPRPWIEWSPGASNVEVPLVEALACTLPQGVAGCGFESPLESMHRAIARMADPADPAAGFLRGDAHFLAVLVSDETDCSHDPVFDDIFTTNKVFWSDPVNDAAPTSAVCWNAGMACTGGPTPYDACVATDHDSTGAVTSDPSDAVLHPLARYIDALDAVEDAKFLADSDARVQVIVIGGVPVGYPQNPLVYADADDPSYQELFGIGPGCEFMGVTAAPPGRLIQVAQAFAPFVQPVYSICQGDMSGPFAAIADGIVN